MVLWCKTCGALLGLREPLSDWATDRTGLCMACAERTVGMTEIPAPEKPGVDDQETLPKDA
jgi:hypothetical protein